MVLLVRMVSPTEGMSFWVMVGCVIDCRETTTNKTVIIRFITGEIETESNVYTVPSAKTGPEMNARV